MPRCLCEHFNRLQVNGDLTPLLEHIMPGEKVLQIISNAGSDFDAYSLEDATENIGYLSPLARINVFVGEGAAPGTVITRVYKGKTLQVRVLAKGFEFEGERYPSLSAVARVITGAHWNGRLFFRLPGGGR